MLLRGGRRDADAAAEEGGAWPVDAEGEGEGVDVTEGFKLSMTRTRTGDDMQGGVFVMS